MAEKYGTSGGGEQGEHLEVGDARALMGLVRELGMMREDARRWRLALLGALPGLVGAVGGTALTVKMEGETGTQVASVIDSGFTEGARRKALLAEFNGAALRDPLSMKVLEVLGAGERGTVTAVRRDLVKDEEWYSSRSVQAYRREAGVDDCVISVQRLGGEGLVREGEGTVVMVVMAFRRWDDPVRFSVRDRVVLDLLHGGLEWIYRAEETVQRVTRATALSPRLRQTLDFLLAGDTERQAAGKMAISIHTVHGYVKELYVHFGVSSREELLSRWVQSGGALRMFEEGGG